MECGRVRWGWNKYKAYNYVNVIRCYKCWGFDHIANKCVKEQTCRLCAGNHHETSCECNLKKCVNCIEFVNTNGIENVDINHVATDKKCDYDIEILVNELQPDILCLNETHVADDVMDHEKALMNYYIVRTNTNNNRTGGTITYVLKHIKYSVIANSTNAVNGTWLNCIQISNKNGKTNICNIYRSPSGNISEFCKSIIELAEDLLVIGKTIILGDFNIDVLSNKFYAKKLLNKMKILGFEQKIKSPTRITYNSKTAINLVFTSFQLTTNIHDIPKIADHDIISVKI
ncbi:GSCOCG00012116001-RA-CDS, partial [Cotesia congregata]